MDLPQHTVTPSEPEYHGSHCHPMIHAFGTERAGRNLKQCSLCRGTVDTNHDHAARRCAQCPDFVLCIKCFEVVEFPFPSTQIVVRNPTLSRHDESVCVRTRPRSNAYALCVVPAGELIEVVAYAPSKDGTDVIYFRQLTGGWILSNHVVCVLPSERSIAQLSKIHLDYHYDGQADPLTLGMCLQFVDETSDMLQDSPDFGGVMGYLTLLPLHLTLFGSPIVGSSAMCVDVNPLEQVHIAVYLINLLSVCCDKLNEHLSLPPRQRTADAALSYQVKMCTRTIALLSRLPIDSALSASAQEFGSAHFVFAAVSRAAGALQRVLASTAGPCSTSEPTSLGDEREAPRSLKQELCGSTPATRQDTWCTWHGDNTVGDSHTMLIRSVAWYGLELSAHYVMDCQLQATTGKPSCGPEVTSMASVLRAAITCADQLPEVLAYHLCSALARGMHDAEVQQGDVATLHALQWEAYNMDAIEIAVKTLKVVRDEHKVLCALRLLRCVVHSNARMIQLVCTVVIGPLLQLLRATSHANVVDAAFDVCCAFAYNAPSRREHAKDATDGSTLPYCTARIHPQATPFQPMQRYKCPRTGHVVSLCSHCSSDHPPVGLDASMLHSDPQGTSVPTVHAPPDYKYFACQCDSCASRSDAAPCLIVPPVPMTMAQKLLGTGRILSIMAQRLRTHGAAVVNSAGRLSMLICCNEEVAVAMYCSLVNVEDITLHSDAVLAVAACSQFGQIKHLMSLYSKAAVTAYLESPFEFIKTTQQRFHCSTPQQQYSRKTEISNSSAERSGSALGLTPSPSIFQRRAAEESSMPVQLFPTSST